MSWAEAKWIVDNILQKVGQSPNNMREFAAFSFSGTSIGLRFSEPADSYSDGNLICSVGGCMIRMSDTGYPASPSDGVLVVDNKELGKYESDEFIVENLEHGKTYYFSAFPYSSQGVYNLSSNPANRAVAAPEYGAAICVTIDVDDASKFNGVDITCVNDTVPVKTKTVTLAAGERTAYFNVPDGDFYHIQYGVADGYSKPDDTESVEAIQSEDTGEVIEYHGTYRYIVGIYGIMRDQNVSSPAWTRTDAAVGMIATASVGTNPGVSSFNAIMPWAGITRESIKTGANTDVMVKIPKFYYQRYKEGTVEHIRIASEPRDGFSIHPAFNHAGVESDHIYVGAYKTTDTARSATGVLPAGSLTRKAFRNSARQKGAGWGITDISVLSAIQMLMLVEFATYDMQSAIGRGYSDKGLSRINVGSCDSVLNLTGRPAGVDGEVDVVWRGIEGLWGNMWELVDGINLRDSVYYICNDPAKYADDTNIGYSAMSFRSVIGADNFISVEGVDMALPHIIVPEGAVNGSASTFVCDTCSYNANVNEPAWTTVAIGGGLLGRSNNGLFAIDLSQTSDKTLSTYGSRLMYIPPK